MMASLIAFPFFPFLKSLTCFLLKETYKVPGIPFRHAASKLPANMSSSRLEEVYKELLSRARVGENPAHNVILVREWMLVVPRSRGFQGDVAANAASMVGMVWVTKEEILEEWLERGPMKLLCGFGITDGDN